MCVVFDMKLSPTVVYCMLRIVCVNMYTYMYMYMCMYSEMYIMWSVKLRCDVQYFLYTCMQPCISESELVASRHEFCMLYI